MLLDYGLIAMVGLLGSFGHCVGMCGPISVALALGPGRDDSNAQSQWQFHLWLNIGRILSYALVGGAIGAIASVVVASGQLAGVGSELRRGLTLLSGLLLIWFGLVQINPQMLPKIPLLNPMASGKLHDRLNGAMNQLAVQRSPLTPLFLGLVWGLIPCGFLYAAQLTAAQTADLWQGSLTMLAFGLGTLPTMLGMGLITAHLGRDRRGQLFRFAGWLTLLIGCLILFRTGDTMTDYGGHGALICLMLALVARPISKVWSGLLRYRRLLGVGAFVLSAVHILHMLQHAWGWQWAAVQFMVVSQQWGIVCGAIALTLMTPAALTSFDAAQKVLGSRWRRLHLLSVPALVFAAAHTLLVGSTYWGNFVRTWPHHLWSGLLITLVLAVLGVRSPQVWSWFSVEQYYASTFSPATHRRADPCCSAQDAAPARPSGETRL